MCITYKCGRYGALFITELDGDDVLCRIEEEDNDDDGPEPLCPSLRSRIILRRLSAAPLIISAMGRKGEKGQKRRLSKGVKKAKLSRGVSNENFCTWGRTTSK